MERHQNPRVKQRVEENPAEFYTTDFELPIKYNESFLKNFK